MLLLSGGVPCRLFPMSSSPAVPHIIIVIVIHGPFDLWRPCCRLFLTLLSSAIPHIVVIIVIICGLFALRRPHPHHYLVGASSSSSSSTGYLSCRGLVAIVVQWGPPCCHHRHPQFFSPVGALSPSLSLLVLTTLSSSSRGLSLLICPR